MVMKKFVSYDEINELENNFFKKYTEFKCKIKIKLMREF